MEASDQAYLPLLLPGKNDAFVQQPVALQETLTAQYLVQPDNAAMEMVGRIKKTFRTAG